MALASPPVVVCKTSPVATQLGRRSRRSQRSNGADGVEGAGPSRNDTDSGDGGEVTAPPMPSGTPRLVHEPALDGLRGLAVAAVVVFHLDRLEGGFLGVDLFFVLSGFLITSLLIAEQLGTGRVALARFWARRARRLIPALLLVMLVVGAMIGRYTWVQQRADLRGEALATLGYVANWHAMVDDAGYWDMFTSPSPLDHMWSLAIEEQFYVVWPLVVVGLFALARRRGRSQSGVALLRVACIGGALASFGLMASLFSPVDTNRAYYGTDARVGPMLLGAALATVSTAQMRRRDPAATVRSPRWVALAAAGALGFVTWALTSVDGVSGFYYQGGLVLFSLAALVLIRCVTTGRAGPVGAVLRWRPLCALGLISYGVYLWHWPIIVYAIPQRIGVDGLALDAIRVAATLAISTASYLLIERPIRRGTLLRSARQVRPALVGAVAVAVAVLLVTTRGPATDVSASAAPIDLPPGDTSANPYRYYPEDIPPGSERILVVGDSGPGFLAPRMALKADDYDAVVAGDSQITCSPILPEGVFRSLDGEVVSREPCHETRRELWQELADEFEPDVVVFYIANTPGLVEPRLDGEWVHDCDPAYDEWMHDAVLEDMQMFVDGGARIVMTTSPEAVGTAISDDGPEWLACRNATYGRVAADIPGATILDMAAEVERIRTLDPDRRLLRDSVHLSDYGADLVSDWLLPQLTAPPPAPIPP